MKITFVGGGSLEWGTELLTDMALDAPLRGATIMLHDIDQAALDLMARMGRQDPCLDPAMQLLSPAAPMLDEMLEATAAYLPQFH